MDIRINTQILNHPKIKKLIRLKGYEEGFIRLFRLWCWAAENRPQGVLENMDIDDIAIAMDYPEDRTEDCGKLVEMLVALRLLDAKNATGNAPLYAIHDWKDHNSFVYYKENRKKAAKRAAKTRWERKGGQEDNAGRIETALPPAYEPHKNRNAGRNAPSPIPIPIPIPTPNPSPKKNNYEDLNTAEPEQPPEPPTNEPDGRFDFKNQKETDGRKDGSDGYMIAEGGYLIVEESFKLKFKSDIPRKEIDRLVRGDPDIKFQGFGNVHRLAYAIANYRSKKLPDKPIGLLIDIARQPDKYFKGEVFDGYKQQGTRANYARAGPK